MTQQATAPKAGRAWIVLLVLALAIGGCIYALAAGGGNDDPRWQRYYECMEGDYPGMSAEAVANMCRPLKP